MPTAISPLLYDVTLAPDREDFARRTAGRAPVWGEVHLPALDPARLYRHLFAAAPGSFLFESGKGPGNIARYSFMGKSNGRVIEIKDGAARFAGNGKTVLSDPHEALRRLDFLCGPDDVTAPPHFWGGWAGFAGYEAARYFEDIRLRRKPGLDAPDIYFMQTDRVAVYDHAKECLRYIVTAEPGSDYDRLTGEIRETLTFIGLAAENLTKENRTPPSFPPAANDGNPRSGLTRDGYVNLVEKAKAYIAAGDIYQANLAQRFEQEFDGDPFDLYLRLRAVNPAPFAAFLQLEGLAIVSASPERLVKLSGNTLETRPIAGTRPRGRDAGEDRKLLAELLGNEKERAEHLMLVDLERNDLGRVCQTGSVRVDELMVLEKYSHVSHIVSNIRGALRPGVSPREILSAVFPGGTITGCPKRRCMEIIDELEPVARGPYTGSLGYIGFSPHLDLNIIIRSIVVGGGKAIFHAGAGIVADSVPEREYQETLDKAAALRTALVSAGKETEG